MRGFHAKFCILHLSYSFFLHGYYAFSCFTQLECGNHAHNNNMYNKKHCNPIQKHKLDWSLTPEIGRLTVYQVHTQPSEEVTVMIVQSREAPVNVNLVCVCVCVCVCTSVCVYMCVCCLLYTSPSPRDATLSRMPSSA